MNNLQNELLSEIKDFNETFKEKNGTGKCFMEYKYIEQENTLLIYKFIPRHGSLDFNSEGANYGLRYIFGIAALLNVDKIDVLVPAFVCHDNPTNIFHRHGFKSDVKVLEKLDDVKFNTTFTYEIPKPTNLFYEFQNLYFSLMDFLKNQEEEQEIQFELSESQHTSGLPIYIINYNYLDGARKGEFSLYYDEDGAQDKTFIINYVEDNLPLERKLRDTRVYFDVPNSMNKFLDILIESLWESMMQQK